MDRSWLMALGDLLCEQRDLAIAYISFHLSVECWAGSASDSPERYGTSSNCLDPCSGNSAETCGGGLANSMYSVGTLPTPSPLIVYVGCFIDNWPNRALPDVLQDSSQPTVRMTTELCAVLAATLGYTYFATQAGIGDQTGISEAHSQILQKVFNNFKNPSSFAIFRVLGRAFFGQS